MSLAGEFGETEPARPARRVEAELARFEAQKLAFAPLIFQACRVARDEGILSLLFRRGARGASAAEAASECRMSLYATKLLLEACLAAGLARHQDERFSLTKMGAYWEKDTLTRVNADFCHHVCYRGAFHLRDALREGAPAGLRELGDFPTIYEGLSHLAPDVRAAWLSFDHFYSDGVFETCLDEILRASPKHIVDVGGNTGRFARIVAARAPDVRLTLVDLPGQIASAKTELSGLLAGAARIDFVEADMRTNEGRLPRGADVYWMSQFLDCFDEDEIVTILAQARDAMTNESRLFILETFWNEQRFEASRYCLIATSLYFACMANGKSRMYHSSDLVRLVARAGLVVDDARHDIGLAHSRLVCRRG